MASFLEEYTLLRELGKGGFATVYKVRHNQLGYVRAIRVLNETVESEDSPVYRKFLKECKTLLRLGNGNNPNIVHIYQPRLLANKALVEMDFVQGCDITHYLEDNGRFLPIGDVLRLAEQMSGALAYCHHDIYRFCMDPDFDDLQNDPDDGRRYIIGPQKEKELVDKYKVIHNDIHSGNIMRRDDGNYVLLDFGLAIEGENVVSSSRRHNGAPEYKSPEKWDNDDVLTERNDIYSFGVVLYEALVGQVPFPFDKSLGSAFRAEIKLMNDHQKTPPPSVYDNRKRHFEALYPGKTYSKDYPDWLEQAILRCLEKDPRKRFANGKELHDFVLKHKNMKAPVDMKQCSKCEAWIPEKDRFCPRCGWNTGKGTEPLPPDDGDWTSSEKFTVNGVSFTMVSVQGGTFTMGATPEQDDEAWNNEKPAHRVTVSDFYMGETEVTQELWQAVMGSNPSYYKGSNLPVEQVSWNDCQKFVRRLNSLTGRTFRLPTEAEWEYAARGGNRSRGYKYAGGNDIYEVAWYDYNSGYETHPVKTKRPNELGMYDMSGNVWEWCQDWYGSYSGSSQTNPKGPSSGSYRVYRGGSWNYDAGHCRVSRRSYFTPGYRNFIIGFRLAL